MPIDRPRCTVLDVDPQFWAATISFYFYSSASATGAPSRLVGSYSCRPLECFLSFAKVAISCTVRSSLFTVAAGSSSSLSMAGKYF